MRMEHRIEALEHELERLRRNGRRSGIGRRSTTRRSAKALSLLAISGLVCLPVVGYALDPFEHDFATMAGEPISGQQVMDNFNLLASAIEDLESAAPAIPRSALVVDSPTGTAASWIQSVTYEGSGVYTVVFEPATFGASPVCTCTPGPTVSTGNTICLLINPDSDGVQIWVRAAESAAADWLAGRADFNLMCAPEG